LRQDPDKGYNFEYDVANLEWLRNSIKERVDKKTGKNIPIKIREGKGTYRYSGYSKDFVKKLAKYHDNSKIMMKASPQNQDFWLGGTFDARGNFGGKGYKTPTITLTSKNPEKLSVVQELLFQRGIESKIIKPDQENSKLVIQDLDNLKTFQNTIPIEKQQNSAKLGKLIEKQTRLDNQKEKGYVTHPENLLSEYKKEGERFDHIKTRNELGTELEEQIKPLIKYTRPGAIRIKLYKPKNCKGKGIKPDFVLKHPNGTIEAIDIKLNIRLVGAKEYDYNSNEKIDRTTIVFLEGIDKTVKIKHGKPFNYESIDQWIEEAKKQAKTKADRKEVSKVSSNLRNLGKRAKELKANRGPKEHGDDKKGGNMIIIIEKTTTYRMGNSSQSSDKTSEAKDEPSENNEENDHDAGGGESEQHPEMKEAKNSKNLGKSI